jgi:aryl-alcohol dehydrogenase-like predicted oxidoreductase
MVSEIGFGALSIGGLFGATSEEESFRALDRCQEIGITHIDTALIYGPHISEEVIGRYLMRNPSARNTFAIATKGGFRVEPRGISNSATFLRECLEGSLRRLKVDHVALYYVHRREQAMPIEEVTETLANFQKEGKIGGIGFSEIAPTSLERASKVHHIMAVQSEYSLWSRLPELGLLQACQRLGTALVAFSPLARGTLSEVTLDPMAFPDSFRREMPRFQPGAYERNLLKINAFKAFAASRGWHPSALALAWVLSRGKHVIPIPGTRTAEHVSHWVAASDIHLSTDDLARIDEILPAGWAEGNRYSEEQQKSSELYC